MPEEETEEEIRIIWDKSQIPKRLNPTVDLIDDKYYFGVLLPVSGAADPEGICFVNSDKECFLPVPAELGRRNFILKFPAVTPARRWSLDSIKAYLDGVAQIDNPKVLKEIEGELRKHIDLPDDEREYTFISLWIIGTYLQSIWMTYPYLGFSGVKRTGKSKVLKFLEMLAFNGMFSTNISTPVLYRMIQSMRCTILMDEAEALSDVVRKTELKNILYSGYKKYGYVFRAGKTAGDKIVPEKFEVFSPKAFVTYRGLEEILSDRSIRIIMIRTIDREIGDSEIDEFDQKWKELRNKLYIFTLENWKRIQEIYKSLPPIKEISQRPRELWKPILALARFFGEDVFEKMKQLAFEKTRESKMEERVQTRESILLATLKRIVTQDGFYAIVDIKNAISEQFGEDISDRWIGRTMSRGFGFKEVSRLSRRGRPVARRLTVKRINDLVKRYGAEEEPSPPSGETVPSVQTEQPEQEYSDNMIKDHIRGVHIGGENRVNALIDAVKINFGITDENRILRLVEEVLSEPKKLFGVEVK